MSRKLSDFQDIAVLRGRNVVRNRPKECGSATPHHTPHLSDSEVSSALRHHGVCTPSSIGLLGSPAPSVSLSQSSCSACCFSSASSLVESTSACLLWGLLRVQSLKPLPVRICSHVSQYNKQTGSSCLRP